MYRNKNKQNCNRIRCYYCRQRGHKIIDCKVREFDEASALIEEAIDIGIQNQIPRPFENHMIQEYYMVTGTGTSHWNPTWYVSFTHKFHVSPNKSLYQNFIPFFGALTQLNQHEYHFIHGIGEIFLPHLMNIVTNPIGRIPCVFHVPTITTNILSFQQLTLQGFIVRLEGTSCSISRMFGGISNNAANDQNTRRDDGPQLSFQIPSNYEVIEKITKLDNLEVMDLTDCMEVFDLLGYEEFVEFYCKDKLQSKFKRVVDWFINKYYRRVSNESRPFPPCLQDGKEVDLLTLYLLVHKAGGFRSVSYHGLWSVIAIAMGSPWQDGIQYRVIYLKYLDLLVYYYEDHRRSGTETVGEASTSGNTMMT